jgi:hypothetical protein
MDSRRQVLILVPVQLGVHWTLAVAVLDMRHHHIE